MRVHIEGTSSRRLGMRLFPAACLALALGASLALAAGWHDRAAALFIWYAGACLLGRNPLIANPSLPFVGWLLLAWAVLAPDERLPTLRTAAWVVMAAGYTSLWEFTVPPARQAEFEAHYGPAGAWVRLFRRGAGYLGSELLQDCKDPQRYLTVDRWESVEAWRAFRSRFAADYERLDREQQSELRRQDRHRLATVRDAELSLQATARDDYWRPARPDRFEQPKHRP